MRLKKLSLILAMLAVLLTVMPTLAAPQIPASYYGTVQVNGANVAEGTEITVWHNGTQYGQGTTTIEGGLSGYNVQVNVDDPETAGEQEGVPAGTTVTFKIGSLDAEQSITVQAGARENLNLSATGSEVISADFTCTPTSGESPLTVNCTDQSTGNITSRSWEFGDGTTSTEQNPTHIYNTDGTYTVALTVTGANGSDTESKNGYISVSSSPILTTTLQVEPSYVEMYVGQTMSLTLTIEETENLYGLEVTCATDANVLPLQNANFMRGDFFGSDALEGINDVTVNRWHGALSQKNPAPALSGDGDFATLTVSAITTGTLELDCTPLVSNEDGFGLPISALHSTIKILQPPIGISGLSTYQSRRNHAGIEVSATGPTNKITTTLETGRFELPELSFGSYEIKAETPGHLYNCIDNVEAPPGEATVLDLSKLLAGDVNGDHKINIFDATAVTSVFSQAPVSGQPTDFNADGIVDIFDLTPLGRNFNKTRLDSDNNPICIGW